MNQRSWLIGAAAAAFLLFLVARVPASVALGWLGADALQATGVSGTAWTGSATSIVAGRLRLGETSWSLSPAGLLGGSLRTKVQARIGDGRAEGLLARSLSGTLSCTACRFEGPVSALWSVFPALKAIGGRLELEVAALDIAAGWPERAIGTAQLTTTLANAEPPANFRLAVNADPVAEDGNIDAVIEDAGGPLKLSARLVLAPPGNFRFSGQATLRPGAPPAIAAALSAMGPRAADGSTQLTLEGSF
jgi:hypothetical protein